MSGTFLDRHKKKGLLALLLLLLKRGRGAGPVFLLVTVLSLLFVAPAGLGRHIPWADKLAKIPGLGLIFGPPGRLGLAELGERFRLLRDGDLALWDPVRWRRGPLPGGRGVESSVELVKGDGAGSGRGVSGGEAIRYSDKIKGGGSINGVFTPEEASKREDGVPLSEGELLSGLMGYAHAAALGGVGLHRGAGALPRGVSAVSPGGGGVQGILDSAKGPEAGPGKKTGGGGKADPYAWQKTRGKIGESLKGPKLAKKGTAMYQLAISKAYSAIAVPAKCKDTGCPKEFASNASGVPFVGGRATDGILNNPELGDGVELPDLSEIQPMVDEVEKLESQAKQCEAALAEYAPKIEQVSRQIQQVSDANQDCKSLLGGGSACKDSGKVSKCKAAYSQYQSLCAQYNGYVQAMAAACPLSGGAQSSMNCNPY